MGLCHYVYKCVRVCIHTCVYIYKYKSDILLHTNTYTPKHTYTHTQRLPSSNMAKTPFLMSSNCSLLAAVIAYIYIYIYMYVCTYIYTHFYLQICIHTYIYVYIFICIQIYIYMHIYTCAYIYVCIYRDPRDREPSLRLNEKDSCHTNK